MVKVFSIQSYKSNTRSNEYFSKLLGNQAISIKIVLMLHGSLRFGCHCLNRQQHGHYKSYRMYTQCLITECLEQKSNLEFLRRSHKTSIFHSSMDGKKNIHSHHSHNAIHHSSCCRSAWCEKSKNSLEEQSRLLEFDVKSYAGPYLPTEWDVGQTTGTVGSTFQTN